MPNPSTLYLEEFENKFDGDIGGGRQEYVDFTDRERPIDPNKLKEAMASMKIYASGANRAGVNTDGTEKVDYEGFISPIALLKFGEYMNKNRKTAVGIRESDNWQLGISKEDYMKSLIRHVLDVWLLWRMQPGLARESWEDALCGIWFNTQGLLHESFKEGPTKVPE